jgi:hypothetical protein
MNSELLRAQLHTLLSQSRLLARILLRPDASPPRNYLLDVLHEAERHVTTIEDRHLVDVVLGPSGRRYCAGNVPTDLPLDTTHPDFYLLIERESGGFEEVYTSAGSADFDKPAAIRGWALSYPSEDVQVGLIPEERAPGVWETVLTHEDGDETKFDFLSEAEGDAFLEGLFAERVLTENRTRGVFGNIPWTPRVANPAAANKMPRYMEMYGQIKSLSPERKDKLLVELAATLYSDRMCPEHEWTQDTIENVDTLLQQAISFDALPTPIDLDEAP